MKSFIGGMASILISSVVTYIAYEKGIKMFTKNDPEFLTIDSALRDSD